MVFSKKNAKKLYCLVALLVHCDKKNLFMISMLRVEGGKKQL